MDYTNEGWSGTVADLRKWLDQFKDTDTITFYGEEDVSVSVNDKEVICWW